MKLVALQNFAHAEDTLHTVERIKGESFEVENEEHGQRLIDAELAGLETNELEKIEEIQELQEQEMQEVNEPENVEEAPTKTKQK